MATSSKRRKQKTQTMSTTHSFCLFLALVSLTHRAEVVSEFENLSQIRLVNNGYEYEKILKNEYETST